MEKLKFITEELNKLFASDYNCSSFSSLSDFGLLQVVVDVMSHLGIIDPLEVRNNPENATFEILNSLEAVKYVPEYKVTPADFRNGIAEACTATVYPILEFLLGNMENVKKRHYLSKFVSKIPIPEDMLQDPKVKNLDGICLRVIDEFWKAYTENKKEKANASEAAELEDDIWQMRLDLGNLHKRLNLQKDKLNKEGTEGERMNLIEDLCSETKRSAKIQKQIEEEKLKFEMLKEEFRKCERRDKINNLEDLLERSEHYKSSQSMCEGILHGALNDLEIYRMVYEEGTPDDRELEELQQQNSQLQKTIQDLNAEKETKTDPCVEAFVNQIKALAKTKAVLTKQIMKLKLCNEEILGKNESICSLLGGDVLHGKSLKEYVAKLRHLSLIYKHHKNHLNGLATECGILGRTLDILHVTNPELKRKLAEKAEFLDRLQDECRNSSEIEQRSKIRNLYREYEKLRSNYLLEDIKYKKVRTMCEQLEIDHANVRTKFDESTGNLSDDIEKIKNDSFELQELIEMELEDLNKYVEEAEHYKDCLLRYSQGIIENAGDEPFVETVRHKLKLAEDRGEDLRKQLDVKRIETEQAKTEQDLVKNVMEMINSKRNFCEFN